MDPYIAYTLTLIFILSLIQVICGDASVLFLDSPTLDYFRHSPAPTTTLSPFEIGAAASVLLGFAPPTLTATSSSKLNEVLMPNPFNRPRAILLLEIAGAEDSQIVVDSDKSAFSSALRLKVVGNEQRLDIQLPDEEEEVSVVSLNEVPSSVKCSDKELSDFASWLGGSYMEDASRPLNGELIIPLANGASLRLHMSERADLEYMTNLVLILNNIRRAMEMHQLLTKSERVPAELITGRFVGIKALQDHYGKEGIAQNGLEVFVTSISKAFDSLQAAYKGKIVGVIIHGEPVASELETMLHVTVTSRSSARWLEETEVSADPSEVAEVIFVRKTLAWLTGIILLIATLLGIHFLMNMPLTKDTLLYSNVKLD